MAKAKKEKFHSTAPLEVQELLDDVIDAFHDDLAESNFLVLFKHGGWQSKGKTVLGKVQVLSDAFRRTMNKDAIIYLNADMWALLSATQKKYVLDHQLYTLNLVYDRHDNVKEAADGRALLTTVPHDIEGFVDVVKRHGIIMEDVKRLARAMTETNQITLEDALKFEQNENAAEEFRNKIEQSEQKEGIVYTLDEGAVKVIDTDKEDEKPQMPNDDDLPY